MPYSAPPLDPPGAGTNAPLSQRKKVAYFYDTEVGNYAYNAGHLMKPHRIRMTHSLVMNYGVYKQMDIYRAKPASKYEMTQFHTDEYVDFLQRITPDNEDSFWKERARHNVGEDCPAFDGLFEFCGISAGGSMEGAARLNRDKCDMAINWAGGLHHAKKNEASGFCYINDIVLAIIELLRFHPRVLYIDIDVHHGDGVEEAFYTTDRVMCVSFHKFGEFFPGTGDVRDIGIGQGKHYSVNVPLRDGIDDASYKDLFESIMTWTMDFYQPSAIVLQCGADSLSGDRLGAFNLSMRGHANCVNFIKSFNKPTLFLGGGGYTIRNVARAWAYETGQIVGVEMSPAMPFSDYYEYYSPDFELDVKPSNMGNMNSAEYLAKIKSFVYTNLRRSQAVPSIQLQELPRNPLGMDENIDDVDDRLDDEDADRNASKDQRYTQRMRDKKIDGDDDLSDSEENGRVKRRGIADYQNPYAVDEDVEANVTMREGPVTDTVDQRASLNGMFEGVANGPSTSRAENSEDLEEVTTAAESGGGGDEGRGAEIDQQDMRTHQNMADNGSFLEVPTGLSGPTYSDAMDIVDERMGHRPSRDLGGTGSPPPAKPVMVESEPPIQADTEPREVEEANAAASND